jgi:hypothetical protein
MSSTGNYEQIDIVRRRVSINTRTNMREVQGKDFLWDGWLYLERGISALGTTEFALDFCVFLCR